MTQMLSLVSMVTLLLAGYSAPGSSVTWPVGPGLQAPPASFGPDQEHNGPALNGEMGEDQDPSLICRIVPHPGLLCPLPAAGTFIGHRGASLDGGYVGQQGPSLNGGGAPGPMVRGLVVEGLELPDGTRLGR